MTDHKPNSLPTEKNRAALRRLLISSSVVAIGIYAFSLSGHPTTAVTPQETPAAISVFQVLPSEMMTVTATDLTQSIKVSGTLYPIRQVHVAAQVSGLAETVSVQPGQSVSAGAKLVGIDVLDLRLQLEQQRNTLAASLAQQDAMVLNLERKQQLADRGLTPQSELQGVQSEAAILAANIAALQTQVEQAEANLRRASVVAPFDGVVATRAIEPGQTISSGATLLTMVDLSTMVAEVTAPLSDSARIKLGQVVNLTVRGMDGVTYAAVVDRISPIAEDGTRSVKVFLTLSNPDALLRGGMFVSGTIQVDGSSNAIAVPKLAVVTQNDKSFVMTVVDGKAERREIAPKRSWTDDGLVEVADGLQSGDVVLTARLPQITDGSAVELLGAR